MQQAIQACGKCLNEALLHKNLAYLYRSTGGISDSETELQKAIALDPNDENARKALAALENLPATRQQP
jgi:Flp pilus assembly protein TadD